MYSSNSLSSVSYVRNLDEPTILTEEVPTCEGVEPFASLGEDDIQVETSCSVTDIERSICACSDSRSTICTSCAITIDEHSINPAIYLNNSNVVQGRLVDEWVVKDKNKFKFRD